MTIHKELVGSLVGLSFPVLVFGLAASLRDRTHAEGSHPAPSEPNIRILSHLQEMLYQGILQSANLEKNGSIELKMSVFVKNIPLAFQLKFGRRTPLTPVLLYRSPFVPVLVLHQRRVIMRYLKLPNRSGLKN